ncbi:MAG: hypothetical protein HZB19_15785 [Chloroflexi bacterium]|nr:hypothetical protein [Chloroflexota bacterium]
MSGLIKTPIIVTRLPAIVSVGHGAGETPSAGFPPEPANPVFLLDSRKT